MAAFYRQFPVTMELYFYGTCPKIVSNDGVNRLEVVAWVETNWVDRTELGKMAAYCYRVALVDLFWVIFLAITASYMVDLSQDLFLVLRKARWKWCCG